MKTKEMNEALFLELLQKVLPKATKDAHLARAIYDEVAKEVRLVNSIAAFEKFCAKEALPNAELDAFVARLARRIASFPADAVRSTKQVLNELTLPGADAIRADARRFQQLVRSDTVKARLATLFVQGLQTRGPLELDLGERLESL